MPKVRYGIAGCGVIFRTHVKALRELNDCADLAAVCDTDPEALQKAVEETGARGCRSVPELVALPDIDAVIVCTPSGLHAQCAIAALDAGKHAISEKPMDVVGDRADEMIAAAKRNRRLLAVISQTRYGRGFETLHEWLDQGRFGRLVYGAALTYYYRSQSYYDSAGWRGTWALDGGGALMNQGIHYADQLVWAMGTPKSVYARAGQLGHERIEVEDIVSATIEFESGAIGSLTATTCAYPGRPGVLDIVGSAGSARVSDGKLVDAAFVDEGPIRVDDGGESVDPRLGGFSEHGRQLRDITQAILAGREPEITMDDGRNALGLVLAIYESARENRAVAL